MKCDFSHLLIALLFLPVSTTKAQVLDTMMMDFYSNQLHVNGRKIYPVVKEEYRDEVETALLEISLPNSTAWRREEPAVKSYHKKHLGRICETTIPGVDFSINVVLDTSNHSSYQQMFVQQAVNGMPKLIPVLQPYVDASLFSEALKKNLYQRLVYFGYLDDRPGRKIKFNRKYEEAIMSFSRQLHDYAGYPYVHLHAIEILLNQTIR